MEHLRPTLGAPSYSRGVPQQQPHAPRRGPGPMLNPGVHPHPQMSAAQQQQAQQAAFQERELAKRRAKRPTDRTMPPGVDEFVPAVETYERLREMERRYDAAVMRKRLDIQDAINRSVKNQKTLRIFVSNTTKDQPWQMSDRPLDENAFDFDTGSIPTFRVRIEGRLLDESPTSTSLESDDSTNSSAAPSANPLKFSHFFKSITVELDRSKDLHPDDHVIEWRKPQPNTQPALTSLGMTGPSEFDCFTFTRKGDESVWCTIRLELQDTPDRFRLSPALADLLDTKEDTRAGIVMKIWEYVRLHGLQDPEEKRWINCDAALRSLFRVERLYFPQIPEVTLSHILPAESITIRYQIRTDVAMNMSQEVYDVQVNVDDPIRMHMHAVINMPGQAAALQEIARCDEQIAVLVQAVAHSKAKHDFWEAFAEDPAAFINRWVSSQKRDLDTIMGEAPTGSVQEEEARRAKFFDKVGENVYLLLANQMQKRGQV